MTSCQEHMWRMGDDDEDDARLSHHGEEGVWGGEGKTGWHNGFHVS